MSTPPALARVFGFVAAEADACVLLRRGPGKHTLMVRWDPMTDEFEIGQWLYTYVSDAEISRDGRLFAYQAHKSAYRPDRYFAYTTYYYNCVSRPPYFTALAFWDTRFSSMGLRWVGDRHAKPIAPPNKGKVPDTYRTSLVLERIPPFWGGEDQAPAPSKHLSNVGELILYRESRQPDLYSLSNDILEADWADIDHRSRLIFARAGKVFVRDAKGERELIDLNPYKFRPIAPPAWATRWP